MAATPTPTDIRVLALRRAGQPINGELEAVSPPFQRIARRLVALEDHAVVVAVLDAFLDARDDADAIRRAIRDDRLDEPPAEDEAEDDTDCYTDLWPAPPADEAYHGVIGQIVRRIEPNTEADPVAILAQLLVMFGNMIGRAAYFVVEADRHHGNENLGLVGISSKGKKGSSYGQCKRVAALVDPDWVATNIVSGLSSDAGLLWALRDATEQDEGIKDKRLLVYEGELANVFGVMKREGNTLSGMIRNAWDGLTLRSLTTGRGRAGPPVVASDPHLSIIGHITRAELTHNLSRVDAANGFVNRFIWLAVRRSKYLPRGGVAVDVRAEADRLQLALDFARRPAEILLSEEAGAIWDEEYEMLSSPPPGLLGSALSRADAHVRRLAMLYALADRSATVEPPHLRAALAFWHYAVRSARFIFGESLGDPLAETILAAIRKDPGLSRTSIMKDVLQGNKSKQQMDAALAVLVENGLAHPRHEPGRRKAECWYPGRNRDA